MNFKNSFIFSPAATYFKEHRIYTTALPGTKDYYEFWDEERDRCLYGYAVDNIAITGFHYF